jgi:ABC-type nickel/cobalt efflux system permease component RcnA
MLTGLALAGVLAVLWLSGALGGLAVWLAGAQRAAQDQLAGAIRSLRAGEAGALAAFWAVCFGYGVLHAAGPGHGKLVIGGYGLARRVPLGRLAGLALASSLAQAAVAVAVVYALVAVLGLAREAVEGVAEDWVTPFGHAMIAGLGLWLVWRGLRGLRAEVAGPNHRTGHDHDDHHHHDHGPHCTHAHGPTMAEVEKVSGLRDGLALVAGIALRPCSGALFVLILTWQLGIGVAGVIGAFVMGLGTALVTLAVAFLAVWAREGAFAALPGRGVARAVPILELGVGLAIAAAALGLLVRSL